MNPSRAALAIGAFLIALLAPPTGAAPQGTGNRVWFAECQWSGPLESLELRVDGGATKIADRLGLARGRTELVPLPVRSASGWKDLNARVPSPQVTVRPGTSSDSSDSGPPRLIEFQWIGKQPEYRWKALPASLRALGRPPVSHRRSPASTASLALLVLGAVLAIGWRRRPGVTALVGGAAGIVCWLLPLHSGPAGRPDAFGGETVRVIDGDLASGNWISTAAGPEVRLACGGDAAVRVLRLSSSPAGAELELRRDLRETSPFRAGTYRVAGAFPGVGLWLRTRMPGRGQLDRDLNRGPRLDPLWLRHPDGTIERLPPWKQDERYPGRRPAAKDRSGVEELPPPGWLLAGLPPARPVLLGRWDLKLDPRVDDRPGGTWVRVLGFGEP